MSAMNRIPSGYKQTEVGIIPEDWTATQLKKISPVQSVGLVINPSTYVVNDGTVPMLVGSDVSANSISWENARRISDASNKTLPASRLYAGDLVTVRVGEPGITAVIPPELDGCNCASMMIVRKHKNFDSHWLCYVMNSRSGLAQVENVQYGTAQKQFNISDAINFTYPTPPLSEQRAIATALSDVDALIAAQDKLIAKKRDIKQAAMQQLLTGKQRLPGFSGEWEVKRLGKLLHFQVGCPFSSDYFNQKADGIRLVKNRDLKSDDQTFYYSGNFDDAFLVQNGDVLIGMDGDFLPCLWSKGEALLNQRVGRVVPHSGLDASFAYYHFMEPLKAIEYATSCTTVKHLSHSDIENIELSMPELEEQTAIAAVLSDMDADLAALEQQRDKTRALKQGMMQVLLTGKIRLTAN